MAAAREAITDGRFSAFRAGTEARLHSGGGGDGAVAAENLVAPQRHSRTIGPKRIPGTLGRSG